MIADPAGSAWTFGGSILTFAFPMLLFIVVACALYVAYTKPELVPGHRNPAAHDEAWHAGFSGGRHVRKKLAALCAGNGQGHKFSCIDQGIR